MKEFSTDFNTIIFKYKIFESLHKTFMFPTTFKKGTNIVTGLKGSSTCRETYIAQISNLIKFEHLKGTDLNKFMRIGRVLLCNLTEDHINVFKDNKLLKILNLFEKYLDFPQTKAYITKSDKTNAYALLFKGSNKWYYSSSTLSLWLLLIRICVYDGNYYTKEFIKKIKDVKNWKDCHKILKKQNITTIDMGYIRNSIHIWAPLMKNCKYIFSTQWKNKFNIDKIHNMSLNKELTYIRSIGKEGITILASGKSIHIGSIKLKEILDKEK